MNVELKDSGVIFIDDPRGYWLGDLKLKGLTGLIGSQLFPNKYSAVPDHILKNAAARGNKIHDDIEAFDMFGTGNTQEVKWYADMKEKEGFEVIYSEYLVTDGTHYASAIDKVMIVDGKVCLGDVKTTAKLDLKYISWQLSIYKYLFNLLNPDIAVDKLYAIWVRDGAFLHEVEEVPIKDVEELLQCGRDGRQYYRKDVLTKIDKKSSDLVKTLSTVLSEISALESIRDELKQGLEQIFEKHGVEKWSTDLFDISRVNSYNRESFNSKQFKEDNPELYSEYVKETEVKPSIRIKLKTN